MSENVKKDGPVMELRPGNEITTKDGLLFRDGKMIPMPEADNVAQAYGYVYAERLVRALEGLNKAAKVWTVILLYPDYATGDFGADIYVECATCDDPVTAAQLVKLMAYDANGGDGGSINDPNDFRPIAVMAGEITLELDATHF